MQKILFFLLLLPFAGQEALGQKRYVVTDVETRQPISGVNVESCSRQRITTDSLGYFIVPDTCRSLVFSHVKYEPRIVNTDEVGDTIFLISRLLMTKEVYVLGKAKKQADYSQLQKSLKMSQQEAQLVAANPAGGFNILGIFSYFKNKKKQKKKDRLKKLLEEY